VAAEAHLLEEPAPLVGAVSEASVVVSPGTLLRVKARRLLLRLGLAHRTRSWVGTAASCHGAPRGNERKMQNFGEEASQHCEELHPVARECSRAVTN